MHQIKRISFYRYGVQVCEQSFLPRLIRRLEPVRGEGGATLILPAVADGLVTEQELKNTLEQYQFADKYIKLGLGTVLMLIAAVLSLLVLVVPVILLGLIFLGSEGVALVFLLGVYVRFNARRREWQALIHREILLEKIEYYARVTSSAIIAQLLVDIEKARTTQREETRKAQASSALQSVLQTENLQQFEQLMDQREEKNKWRSLSIHAITFIAGYLSEKGLDKVLLGVHWSALFVK
jgi:hypothetical protein